MDGSFFFPAPPVQPLPGGARPVGTIRLPPRSQGLPLMPTQLVPRSVQPPHAAQAGPSNYAQARPSNYMWTGPPHLLPTPPNTQSHNSHPSSHIVPLNNLPTPPPNAQLYRPHFSGPAIFNTPLRFIPPMVHTPETPTCPSTNPASLRCLEKHLISVLHTPGKYKEPT
jgi:hypothetical protein